MADWTELPCWKGLRRCCWAWHVWQGPIVLGKLWWGVVVLGRLWWGALLLGKLWWGVVVLGSFGDCDLFIRGFCSNDGMSCRFVIACHVVASKWFNFRGMVDRHGPIWWMPKMSFGQVVSLFKLVWIGPDVSVSSSLRQFTLCFTIVRCVCSAFTSSCSLCLVSMSSSSSPTLRFRHRHG